MEALRTQNLSKRYNQNTVLSDINISIDSGDIYGLIGKNGAGKTTLMRIITGLIPSYFGDVYVFGEKISSQSISYRSKIGAIIESPSFYPNLDAYKNLKAVALLMNINNANQRVLDALDFAGLADTGKKQVRNFSLGMKQRLAIAMALLNDPEMLILDEPVNGLDPSGIVDTRNILKQINRVKGTTIIISSHILSELSHIVSKVGIIDRGKLVEQTDMAVLNSKLKSSLNITIAVKENIPQAVELIKSKFNISDIIVEGDTIVIKDANAQDLSSQINMELVQNFILVKGITVLVSQLEDYFLQLTRR